METVLVTGGTGLIGKALTGALLQNGYNVVIVTRKARSPKGNVSYAEWHPVEGKIDEEAIAKADYIVHLAGANVGDKRWTAKRKKEILDSRVKSGALLVDALTKMSNKVKAVISASATGWYGPDPQIPNPQPFVETDAAFDDFLGNTCQQWEAAIKPVTALGKRLVILRTGIVLSNKGGAYAEFKKPLKLGVAGILGNGRQIISWIHIDDIVRMYLFAIANPHVQGVYNAVAPHPVSNKALVMQMAKQRRKFYVAMHVPAIALKLALGEMSIEVLKSFTVSPHKIEKDGFQFGYPRIEDAIRQLEAT